MALRQRQWQRDRGDDCQRHRRPYERRQQSELPCYREDSASYGPEAPSLPHGKRMAAYKLRKDC
jgi:hypothetical protein